MKNLVTFSFLFLATLFATDNAYGQQNLNRLFKKNQTDVYLSLGLIPTFLADDSRQILPPLSLGIDHMVGDNFSLGASIGHSRTRSQEEVLFDGLTSQYQNNYYEFTIKAGLHNTNFDNMSIYGGFLLSYHLSNVEILQGDADLLKKHKNLKQ